MLVNLTAEVDRTEGEALLCEYKRLLKAWDLMVESEEEIVYLMDSGIDADWPFRTTISAGRKALLSDLRNVIYLHYSYWVKLHSFVLQLYICKSQLTGQVDNCHL
jgi:hypothetical protein